MILIHCRFGIAEDDRAAWAESARRMASASRREPGCLAYDFSVDVLDPGIVYAYEAWESEEALEAHTGAPHHRARMQELEGMRVDYQEIRYFGVEWDRDGLADRAAREEAR
jgi:quinol monooxygenase YgiN